MSKETIFQKIIRKSGQKPVSCKCQLCKSQCQHPCQGIPEDFVALVDAGYADRLIRTQQEDYIVLQPKYDPQKRACTFFTDGLCELHRAGLKPTAGKLSHHTQTNRDPKKTIAYLCIKEWAKIPDEYSKKVVAAIEQVK